MTMELRRRRALLGCAAAVVVALAASAAAQAGSTCVTQLKGAAPDAETSWIDPDTPSEACMVDRCTDANHTVCVGSAPPLTAMQLVYSDEFTSDGRSFGAAAADARWTAQDIWYQGTQDLQNYKAEQVTTQNGSAVITMENRPSWALSQQFDGAVWNVSKNYTSGQLTSWNKFCFTGGYLEARVQLPGDSYISGFWPSFWLLGNLLRPGYQATGFGPNSLAFDKGIWPFSYNTCGGDYAGTDQGGNSPQNLSACVDPPGFDRTLYGMARGVGRGAPEIDILEAKVPPSIDAETGQPIPLGLPRGGGPGQHPVALNLMTLQSGPLLPNGTSWMDPFNDSPQGPLGPGIHLPQDSFALGAPLEGAYSHANYWLGDFAYGMLPQLKEAQKQQGFDDNELQARLFSIRPGNLLQDSLSALITLNDSFFEQFHTFGLDWKPEQYVRWHLDGQLVYEVNQEALRSQRNDTYRVGERLIPVEAMQIVLSLGMSDFYVAADLDRLSFPAQYKIDYVRLYQDPAAINLGCSPKEYPTAQFLACKRDTYLVTEADQALIPDTCQALPSCRAQAGVEFAGDGLLDTQSNVSSPQDCCRRCGDTPGCAAYTWSPYAEGGTCTLRRATGWKPLSVAGSPREGIISGEVLPPSGGPSCQARVDVEFQGSSPLVQAKNVATARDCCSLCGETAGCRAYTWVPDMNSVCKLWGSERLTAANVTGQGTTSGLVLFGGASTPPPAAPPPAAPPPPGPEVCPSYFEAKRNGVEACNSDLQRTDGSSCPLSCQGLFEDMPLACSAFVSQTLAQQAGIAVDGQQFDVCKLLSLPLSVLKKIDLLQIEALAQQWASGNGYEPPPPPSPSSTPVGAIVGGVIGGLALLAILAFLALRPRKGWLRRRQLAGSSSEEESTSGGAKEDVEGKADLLPPSALGDAAGSVLDAGRPPLLPPSDPASLSVLPAAEDGLPAGQAAAALPLSYISSAGRAGDGWGKAAGQQMPDDSTSAAGAAGGSDRAAALTTESSSDLHSLQSDPLLTLISTRLATLASEHGPAGRRPSSTGSRSSLPADVRRWEVQWEQLELVRRIGAGSFGRVYLANWRATPVAVKVLIGVEQGKVPAELQLPEGIMQQLLEEAAVLARLRHPNLVALLGVCQLPPCLLTEYCSRGSLYSLLQEAAADPRVAAELTWRRRLSLALDMSRGLLYLHLSTPAIIHRDVKSPNCLVDEAWRAKVCDFNLSEILRKNKGSRGEEDDSRALNKKESTEHTAPEVLAGQRAEAASDCFSLGLVLYELLTWRLPWPRASPFQIFHHVREGRRPKVPAREELPGPDTAQFGGLDGYCQLMRDCSHQDPRQRPTMETIVQRLAALLAQEQAVALASSGGGG